MRSHCLSKGRGVTVNVGSDRKEQGQMMSVRRYVVHPNYDEATDEYDVGLIFLEESTSFDIAFPRINDEASRPAPGSFARVMG